MKNRKLIFIGLFIFLSVVIGSFIYFPKSIDTALNRIKYPFEVGEILTSQQIDENLIVVIYTNKNNNNELQNAIIQKNSIFYSVVEMNGSLNIELENLESSVEYYYSAKRVSGEELKRIERYLERIKNMKDIGI